MSEEGNKINLFTCKLVDGVCLDWNNQANEGTWGLDSIRNLHAVLSIQLAILSNSVIIYHERTWKRINQGNLTDWIFKGSTEEHGLIGRRDVVGAFILEVEKSRQCSPGLLANLMERSWQQNNTTGKNWNKTLIWVKHYFTLILWHCTFFQWK